MDNLAYFNEEEYIEGFNLGYKIASEFPELAEFIQNAKGVGDKLDGLKDGREQYLEEMYLEKEKQRVKKPSIETRLPWLKKDRLKNLDKDIDEDIDKNKGIEPEI